jgi:hypothetical protein
MRKFAGTLGGMRMVTPSPASTAAHNPGRLGLVKVMRHLMPAASRAASPG